MGMEETGRSLERLLQSTLLWGSGSLALAIIITVVAAMTHDIRWALFFSIPFAGFAGWEFTRTLVDNKRASIIATISTILAWSAMMGFLDDWLSPPAKLVNGTYAAVDYRRAKTSRRKCSAARCQHILESSR